MLLVNFLFWTVIDVIVCSGWMYVVLTDNWMAVPFLKTVEDKGFANIIILLVVSGLTIMQIWSIKLYKRGKLQK